MLEVVGHRISRAVLCGWLAAVGRWQFFRGRPELDFLRAHGTFQRLVDINWGSFTGHLYLGLIAEFQMRRDVAMDELTIAYRLNPKRFRRTKVPQVVKDRILWREGLAGDLGLSWRNLDDSSWGHGSGAAGVAQRRSQRASHAIDPPVEVHEPNIDMPAHSDFSSLEEFRAFAGRPPIRPDEVRDADLDSLCERLLREE